MASTPDQLLENARCIDCAIPEGMKSSVLIYVLATMAGMPTDPNVLMDQARCIDCAIPRGAQGSVIIYLLDAFVNGSSGGFVQCGNGAPTSTPPSGCGMYYDTSNDAVYIYRGGAWVLKV